jgi:DNA-directed RNA polymerase specialized sigma24 family protein
LEEKVAVKLIDSLNEYLETTALYYAGGDVSLARDLMQCMSIAIWQAAAGQTRAWYMKLAAWKARDFMKRHRRQVTREIQLVSVDAYEQSIMDELYHNIFG